MTQDQKDFFNEVILPKLINMAIEDKLPSDMNELSYHNFEQEAEKWNRQRLGIKNDTEWTEEDDKQFKLFCDALSEGGTIENYIAFRDSETTEEMIRIFEENLVMWEPFEHFDAELLGDHVFN